MRSNIVLKYSKPEDMLGGGYLPQGYQLTWRQLVERGWTPFEDYAMVRQGSTYKWLTPDRFVVKMRLVDDIWGSAWDSVWEVLESKRD